MLKSSLFAVLFSLLFNSQAFTQPKDSLVKHLSELIFSMHDELFSSSRSDSVCFLLGFDTSEAKGIDFGFFDINLMRVESIRLPSTHFIISSDMLMQATDVSFEQRSGVYMMPIVSIRNKYGHRTFPSDTLSKLLSALVDALGKINYEVQLLSPLIFYASDERQK